MVSVAAIRTGLAAALGKISGLRAYAQWPDQIAELPCAIVGEPAGEYDQTVGGSAASVHRFPVQVYVSAAGGLAQGQKNLDPLLASSSTGGVYGAINADRTLGGAVWWTAIRGYRDYSPAGGNEQQPPTLMGAIVDVEVQG